MTIYPESAAAAMADSTVNVKALSRSSKTKAHKAEIAAAFVRGDLIPRNISQRQAAALVGVSVSYVSHYCAAPARLMTEEHYLEAAE